METSEATRRSVEELAGARMPSDRGLASLGLLMQLGGSAFAAAMGILAMTSLFAAAVGGGWALFAFAASGAVRSAFHRAAGTALIYGTPQGPFRATKIYIAISAGHTALSLVLLSQMHAGGKTLLAWGLLLAAWPIALAVVIGSARLRRFTENIAPSEDLGFEGAAVLMTLLGAMGAAFAATMIVMFVKIPGGGGSLPMMLMVALGIMLLIRSLFQLAAGIKGISGTDVERATDAANRYTSFGVISSVITGGVMMVLLMMTHLNFIALMTIGLAIYLLLVWPTVLRRFFTERNFAVMLAGDEAPVHRRAPDAGLTALGWLLLAQAVITLAASLPAAVFGVDSSGLFSSLPSLSALAQQDISGATRSEWWSVGMSALQLWAAAELIRMTDRHRLAATLYGAVATLVTVYVYWPTVKAVFSSSIVGLMDPGSVIPMAWLAMVLVIPLGTILLVNRRLTPEARARLRRAA